MTPDDRAQLRKAVSWLKPGQRIEVSARDLGALLDAIDRLTARRCAHPCPQCAAAEKP